MSYNANEWKPGDVALVNGRICIRLPTGWEHGDPRAFSFADAASLDVRRLVVIDPEDAERFVDLTLSHIEHVLALDEADRDYIKDATVRALREYANPTPRIDGDAPTVTDAEARAMRDAISRVERMDGRS